MSNSIYTSETLLTLNNVDKTRYRKHLNTVIVTFIACFALLAVLIGSGLIAIFSDPETNNFKLNFIGVLLALFICGGVLNYVKTNDYFVEIYYVWQLKQVQNKIYRRLKHIKIQLNSGQHEKKTTALALLHFYHRSLKLVYLLDDNTLTLDKVNMAIADIEQQAEQANISLPEPSFHPKMLASLL